jgi:endo-1,4-beta-xylanase
MYQNKSKEEFEKFIRSAYSHPAISGILLWGFGIPSLAKEGALLLRMAVRNQQQKLFDLWHNTWSTRSTVVATLLARLILEASQASIKWTIGKQKKT